MRDRIQEALKRSKADYTEIRIEEKETTRVVFRGKELETANANIDQGGIVRCLIKDKGVSDLVKVDGVIINLRIGD